MAITYHAGRRIQGLAPADETYSNTTRTTGQTSYSSNGTTMTHYIGERFTATKWRNVELKTLVVYGSRFTTSSSGDFQLKVFGSDHVTQIGSTITGTPSVSSMPLNSAGVSNTTVTFDLTGITSPNTEFFIGVGTTSTGGAPSYVFYNNAAAGTDGSNMWEEYNGYTNFPSKSMSFTLTYVGGDAKPTDVQVGSRWEETDTRKMYHYNPSANITTDGSDTIITFKGNGTFTPTSAFNVEYLVVAGGGGGGSAYGGGGGAGGYLTGTGHGVTAQAYTITVGAGGSGFLGDAVAGGVGGSSIFSTITSVGGGGGGSASYQAGASGGNASGGGGSVGNGSGGSGGSYGNNGGSGYSWSSPYLTGGGGGGGSGAVGSNGVSGAGGAGGAGTSSSITGSAVIRAGGGGGLAGANNSSNVAGAGGTGGGGAGGTMSTTPRVRGTVGTSNTGSGGGAGYQWNGGKGGSGIVILRFSTSGNTYTI